MTTTTAPSRMQRLLEALASEHVTEDDMQQRDGEAFVSALTERRTMGWDPHDVWLHRIKEPRESRNRDE